MDEILRIKNLSKRYDDISVLENIDLSVKKGEVVVIVGPSGCGKSTLLRCLNGLEEIQEGEVLLDDEVVNPNKKNLSKNREKIGMVFQSYDLFPHLTILQNVTLAPIKVKKRKRAEVEKEALELLERVGLVSKKDNYPRQLSGGQKQRVAIVRALIMHPEVLLLDEITAALDPEMVREVLDVVLALAQEGRTMVIVTHEMQFAKAVADRMVFLEGGKIVEEGNPKEFFEDPKTDRLRKFLQTFTSPSLQVIRSPVNASAVKRHIISGSCWSLTNVIRARKRYEVRVSPVSSFTSRKRQSSGDSLPSACPPTPIHFPSLISFFFLVRWSIRYFPSCSM